MCVQKIVSFVCITLQIVNGVDLDYYFNSALRSQRLQCLDQSHQLLCQSECGLKSALCVNEDCYCISFTSPELAPVHNDYNYNSALNMSCNSHTQQFYCQKKCGINAALCVNEDCYCISFIPQDDEKNTEIGPNTAIIDYGMDYEEDSDIDMIQDSIPEMVSIYALRPTLRHHIAHFCPNLDVAKACIRKCIAVGKPAFCGKDHVCYCGHNYEHSVDKPGDSKNIYAKFKDMYEKYFGKEFSKDTVELE